MESNIKTSKNIPKLYFYWFFHSLIFAYVIERVFGQERGLSVQQMVYVEIVYAFSVMVLEIPTGFLADYYGRKKLMVISSIFTFLEFFVLIFAYNFYMFALSAFFAAIEGSLSSGTSNALLYDSLKVEKKEHEFETVLGKNNFFDAISHGIGALVGAYIGSNLGLVYTYWLSLVSVVISIFISFTFVEPEIKSEVDEEEEKFDLKEVWTFLKESSAIQFVCIYGIVCGSVITYIYEYWQIYLEKISFPVYLFGAYSLISTLFASLSNMYLEKIKKIIGYKATFSLCVFLSGLSLLYAGYAKNIYGSFAVLLALLFSVGTEPLTLGYLHHRTESKYRATAESFISLGLRIATMLVGLSFGYISSNFSIYDGFTFLAMVLLGYGIYYFMCQFKYLKE